MIERKILIPIDFTDVTDKAIEFGKFLARKSQSDISLLHVFEDDGISLEECEDKLKALADKINTEEDISCDFICHKGNIFTVIPEIVANNAFHVMVIATHGPRGIRQKFFGPDILKLLKKICIPTLVVQENSIVPEEKFKTAIFPVGGHNEYDKMIDAMTLFAGWVDPEIHMYSIRKAGFDQNDKLKENIKKADQKFSEKGINFKRVSEDQTVFSVGFAKQTLQYADKIQAGLIAIMVTATREHFYFADSDKEAILTNDKGIPVLCASNAEARV